MARTTHYLLLANAVDAFAREIAAGSETATLPFDTGDAHASLLRHDGVLLVSIRAAANVESIAVTAADGSELARLESVDAPTSADRRSWFRLREPIPTGALLRLVTA